MIDDKLYELQQAARPRNCREISAIHKHHRKNRYPYYRGGVSYDKNN